MKKYLIPVLFGFAAGGCCVLEPKGDSQDISVLPDDLSMERTVLLEGDELPPGAIVLPADEVTIESSEIVLPDVEVAEYEDVVSVNGDGEHFSDRNVAETIIIPAGTSSSSSLQDGLSADAVRVEILNASGIPGLEQKVSEQLAGKGYFISWAGEGDTSGVQHETRIKYRLNFAREAVHLGHVLPGNQIVTRGDEVPEGIDVRIIVGSDQQ